MQAVMGVQMQLHALGLRAAAEWPDLASELGRLDAVLRQEAISLRELMQRMKPLDLGPDTRTTVRAVAEEMGATLQRLQAVDDARQHTEAMEQANRLAGLAARHAADEVAALEAIRPALADSLRSESLHLEWVEGDRLRLVIGENDPLQGHAPGWLSLAGTRTAEALLQGKPLREPLTGRRPEDLFGVPAGLRQLAVAPLHCAGMEGTLQLGRRLPRAYSAGELLLVQLLAERLGLLFAAGRGANVAN